jgi:hypothetical protein
MPTSGAEDTLSENRQVVLILRLVVDRQGKLRHGELLDCDVMRQARFATLTGLQSTIRQWLERQPRDVARHAGKDC